MNRRSWQLIARRFHPAICAIFITKFPETRCDWIWGGAGGMRRLEICHVMVKGFPRRSSHLIKLRSHWFCVNWINVNCFSVGPVRRVIKRILALREAFFCGTIRTRFEPFFSPNSKPESFISELPCCARETSYFNLIVNFEWLLKCKLVRKFSSEKEKAETRAPCLGGYNLISDEQKVARCKLVSSGVLWASEQQNWIPETHRKLGKLSRMSSWIITVRASLF